MSDPKPPIVAGNVYIRPLAALDSDDAAEWTNLGFADAGLFQESPAEDEPRTWRLRSGLPGDERCGALGVQERQGDGGPWRRIVMPCLLGPDHGGDSHEGAAGRWLATGDPRGIVTVWPELADAKGDDDSASGPPFSAVIDRSDYDPAWEPNEGVDE